MRKKEAELRERSAELDKMNDEDTLSDSHLTPV